MKKEENRNLRWKPPRRRLRLAHWLKTSMRRSMGWEKREKRIRSLGENLPWRRPGQAIRVKTSMRHPSCFSKKKEKKEKKNKTNLHWLIAGCKKDVSWQEEHSNQGQRNFLVPSTGSSVFLQETSCRTFGRAKSNFKSESNGGNLLIRPTSTCVSIPCLHPSFFHLLVLLIVLLQELPVEIVGN